MTIYVDSLFLLNGILNFLLLLATARLTGSVIRRWSLALGATVGGLYAVATVLVAFLGGMVFKGLVMGIMVVLAFGWRVSTVKNGLVFLALSCGFGGVVLLVVDVFGTGLMVLNGNAYYPVSGLALLLTAAAVYLVGRVVLRGLMEKPPAEFHQITLENQGKIATIIGFYDTGNALKDPVTNRGILVVDWQAVPFLLPPEATASQLSDPAQHLERWSQNGARWRLIPYGTVGIEGGLLLGKTVETIKIDNKIIKNGLVAFSPTAVSPGGGYQALLGGRL
ncbi:MAG: sigma-E processing peptidase SpoIIGA [Eubacteriales bacterium]